MSDAFEANLRTTGVGSLPWTDVEASVSFVLEAGLSIPFWPQLPRRRFVERMVPQFSESMPCVQVDAEEGRIGFDAADKYQRLEPFYEAYLSGRTDGLGLSQEYAAGFHAFLRRVEGRTWPIVKGHVTGPITFTTSISDAADRPLYADADLRDAAVKLLARKAQWQIERLRPLADECVLIFVDEPVLAAYGSSAYLGITEEDVLAMEGEVFAAIAQADAISGMHVCGNSDWGVMLRTGVQVLNFDAHQYGTTVALYPQEVADLFDRGGCIAWGAVPTANFKGDETPDALARRLDECLAALIDKGFDADLVRRRSMLTPACGTGSMRNPDDAVKVFDLLTRLHEKVTN